MRIYIYILIEIKKKLDKFYIFSNYKTMQIIIKIINGQEHTLDVTINLSKIKIFNK
jgi:hypothetical protein